MPIFCRVTWAEMIATASRQWTARHIDRAGTWSGGSRANQGYWAILGTTPLLRFDGCRKSTRVAARPSFRNFRST